MKRHKSLYPLSHDHHHALVQSRNLRLASSEPGLASFYEVAQNFIAFWDTKLTLHFQQEEEILLPAFSRYSSADREEIRETLTQHVEIHHAVDELKANLSQNTATSTAGLHLAQLLEKHIRYEENFLFPAIEEIVPEDQLWEINRLLISA